MKIFSKKKANLGMLLEKDIILTNEYYLKNNIAVIHKKPTPIQIVKVDYSQKNKTKIKEAYFYKRSTTDFNGIYKGKYIDFDVKETTLLNNFPLKNIHEHQIKHLLAIQKQGGVGFLIINFTKRQKYFLITIEQIMSFWEKLNETQSAKSISYIFFTKNCCEIPFKFQPRLDYLKIIDKLFSL